MDDREIIELLKTLNERELYIVLCFLRRLTEMHSRAD